MYHEKKDLAGDVTKYYLSRMQLIAASEVVPYVVFIVIWGIARAIDFWSGFVEYSSIRLIIAIFIPVILLTIFYLYGNLVALQNSVHKLNSILQRVSQKPWFIFIQIAILALVGVMIYWSRDFRGATPIDTTFFRQSVESAAYFKGLLYNDLVGSQLRAHSNFFLFLLVPFVWLFGSSSWLVIQYIQSICISAWAYFVGRNAVRKNQADQSLWAILVTIGLFLAVYYENANFYDTRFSALAIVIFIFGWLKNNKLVCILGFVAVLITRETTLLSLVFILPFLPTRKSLQGMKLRFFILSILWIGVYVVIMQLLGGASGTGRIDECVTSPSLSGSYFNCVINALATDAPLKIAYTIRLISFAPFALLSPVSISGILPDLGLAWLSKDNVIYSLMWHYYMPPLGIILLLGFHQMNFRIKSNRLRLIFTLWTLSIGLWQFSTIIRPELF